MSNQVSGQPSGQPSGRQSGDGSPQVLPARVVRLLVSHALAAVAMSLPWPLLLLLVWERSGDDSHGELLLGLTAAARLLPYVLLSWATGPLADRFRRDRLLRVTLVARLVLLAAMAAALLQGWPLAAVLAASLAVAAGTPAYPALAAAMPDVAGPARRRATDLLVTVEVASFVVGPAAGGLLLAGPLRPLLALTGVLLSAAALLTVVGVVLPRPARPGAARPGAGAVTALRSSRVGRRAVAVAGALNLVDAVLVLALLPVADQLWHDDGDGYGLATAVLGFGALGAPLLWRLGRSARSRARCGLLLVVAGLVGVPFSPTVAWAVLPLAVMGAATVHVEGAVTEAIQDAVPDAQRAGALGLTDSVMVGSALVGALVAPWLAGALGPRTELLLLASLSAATVALLGGRRAPATVEVAGRPAPLVAGAPGLPSQRVGSPETTTPLDLGSSGVVAAEAATELPG